MKHTKILILFISLMVLFSSCSSDDADDTQSAVGAWNLTDFHGTSTNVVTYNTNNSPTITTLNTQTMVSSNASIVFNDDNTYVANGSLVLRSVTTVNGEASGDSNYTSTPQENGTWAINGDQITTTPDNGASSTGTITEFTDHTLTFKHVIHQSTDNAAGNSTLDSEFYQTYTR